MFESMRERWMQTALDLEPRLKISRFVPTAVVKPVHDDSVHHHWSTETIRSLADRQPIRLLPGHSVVIDFGVHTVGKIQMNVSRVGPTQEGKLSLRFGEIPAEVGPDVANKTGKLGGEWLEPVVLQITANQELRYDTRRAWRYLRIDLHDDSSPITIQDLCAMEQSSVGLLDEVPACEQDSELLRQMDLVSLRTLRNCMQGVFEDGPKRDRRLWLGDLRLQALTNYVSFRNNDLVKRCLYLFAACAYEDGLVPACVYERPKWHGGTEFIPDYALLFGPTLLDYLIASDDIATAKDLWPVALRQTEILDRWVDDRGVFVDPGKVWLFIDWHADLDRQTAIQGTACYALLKLIELGRLVGAEASILQNLEQRRQQMIAATQKYLWAPTQGLAVSGKDRQLSWASHIWLTLGQAITTEQARSGFAVLESNPKALRPVTPYLYHHQLEAMAQCGMVREARVLMENYWGGMIRLGATTFWEVYDPAQPMLSPYDSILHNSYCHAWSCTPAWFIRTGMLDGNLPDVLPVETVPRVVPRLSESIPASVSVK
ncbi:MAG: hypothetical protein HC898_07285 [Phycisphaerales bacterium]|nr:hypothetical protein [Phycisphaerales bacterium]